MDTLVAVSLIAQSSELPQTDLMAIIRTIIPGAVAALAFGLLTIFVPRPSENPRMKVFPKLMLWAWERPEDLRSLPVDRVGVAYLAQTITLHGDRLTRDPRRQPLKVPEGVALMAVTRIEVARGEPLVPSNALRDLIITQLLNSLRPTLRGLQIDFDAKVSERSFYRELLIELRRRMDPGMPLSMTALASWALQDGWIEGLPVDEVVPMCFDMGGDTPAIKAHLAAGRDFRSPNARQAIGLRMEEPLPRLPGSWLDRRRVYLFQHAPWNDHTVRKAIQEFGS